MPSRAEGTLTAKVCPHHSTEVEHVSAEIETKLDRAVNRREIRLSAWERLEHELGAKLSKHFLVETFLDRA